MLNNTLEIADTSQHMFTNWLTEVRTELLQQNINLSVFW